MRQSTGGVAPQMRLTRRIFAMPATTTPRATRMTSPRDLVSLIGMSSVSAKTISVLPKENLSLPIWLNVLDDT